MILTKEQINALREAALPLMHWLNNNCHPHCTAIVDSEKIELVEGLATARRESIREAPPATAQRRFCGRWANGTDFNERPTFNCH